MHIPSHPSFSNVDLNRRFDRILESGGKIQEYHKHAKNDYFSVHVQTSDKQIMNFSNIKPEHLEKYLQKPGHPATSDLRLNEEVHRPTNVTFDQLMNNGASIVSYHPTSRGNFSVQVRAVEPDGHSAVYVFTNISRGNFEKWRTNESVYRGPEEFHPPPMQQPESAEIRTSGAPVYPHSNKSIPWQKGKFEEAMNDGAQIIESRPLHSCSVHVKTGDNQIEHFGNIHPGVLDKYERRMQLEPHFRYRRGSNPRRHNRGDTFEKIMQDPDARIVDICDHTFYSLKVQMPDGSAKAFTHISEETLDSMERKMSNRR